MKKVVQQSKLPLTKKALFKVQHSNTNAGPYWMYNRLKKTVVHTHSKSSESSLHRVSPVPGRLGTSDARKLCRILDDSL
jgi:hypothetical protein